MKPEHWDEIVRLYYAALERKSLRNEVESLLACRPKAAKFMELPALEAAEEICAEKKRADSATGSARQIQEIAVEVGARSGRQRILPPWWMLLLSVPFVACAGFLYFWIFFGPEPMGLMVQANDRARSEGWDRTPQLKQFFKRSLAVDRLQRPTSASRFIDGLKSALLSTTTIVRR